MTTGTDLKIFIDNVGGSGDDAQFAKSLRDRINGIKIGAKYKVLTYLDLEKANDIDTDPDNETNTIKAIEEADIVIPIVTPRFMGFITEEIGSAYDSTINSNDRYFFPVLLKETDWSNYDWFVRSQLTPQDAIPLLDHDGNEQEKIINLFIKKITSSIITLVKNDELTEKAEPLQVSHADKMVFISHDHDDADFAELLKLRLEKEGINSWVDTERLKIGQDWREEIDHGIANSVAVIAIMTPEARKSEYVTYEWAFAWGKGKKIFPLMLKQTQLHPRLESLQYLNFTNHPARPWDELVDSIQSVI